MAALDTEPSDVQDYMRLRFYTATRGGEALSLRWADLDLDAKVWTVPADVSKTGKAHRVPLIEPAMVILRERRERAPGEYAFPTARPTTSRVGRRTGVQDMYKRLRRKSGVTGAAPTS